MALLLPELFLAQSNELKQLSNQSLPVKSDVVTSMRKILSSNLGDIIFFTPENFCNSDKVAKVYKYSLSQNKVDSLQFKLDKKIKKYFKFSNKSICATKDYFFILNDENIVVFKYNKLKLEFLKVIVNEKSFNKAKILDATTLFLYVNYNYHPMDEPDKHTWGKLNLQTLTIESVKKMPDDNVMFAYFVNDWFSIYNGLIAYANTSNYKITLFDKNFNKTDSIVSNVLDSNKRIISKFKFQDNHSKDDIAVLMKEDANTLKRILKITLLDSTHVLAILQLPKTQNYQLDTWKKTNGTWTLFASETVNSSYQKDKAYTKDNTPRFGLFGNTNGVSYLSKGIFSIIYFPYMNAIETPSYDMERDFNGALNELVKTNQLFFGIKQYAIKMD
jgi:hypothetical protein